MVELRQFVSQTLQDVVNGVRDAQVAIRSGDSRSDDGAVVNSPSQDYSERARNVEFDVAISAEETKECRGGLAITVVSVLKGGAEQRAAHAERAVSRVRFTVPVTYSEQHRAIQPPRDNPNES